MAHPNTKHDITNRFGIVSVLSFDLLMFVPIPITILALGLVASYLSGVGLGLWTGCHSPGVMDRTIHHPPYTPHYRPYYKLLSHPARPTPTYPMHGPSQDTTTVITSHTPSHNALQVFVMRESLRPWKVTC